MRVAVEASVEFEPEEATDEADELEVVLKTPSLTGWPQTSG